MLLIQIWQSSRLHLVMQAPHMLQAVHKKVQLQTSRPMQLPFRPEGDNVLLLGLNGPAQQVSRV